MMRPRKRQQGILRPDYVVRGISSITPSDLEKHSITSVLLDYDNTIAGYGEEIEDCERQALKSLGQAGVRLFVVTNAHANRIDATVKNLAGIINPNNIIHPENCTNSRFSSILAEKPSPKMVEYVLGKYSLIASQALLVGDRICNDIVAGNRAGVSTVLVPPLGKEHTAVGYLQRPAEELLRARMGLPVRPEDFPPTLTTVRPFK